MRVQPGMPLELGTITRAHVSKHRQFDKDGKWIEGRVTIGPASGLRKLMRAARRRLVPQERIFLIEHAMRSAANRPVTYHGGQHALRTA